MIFSTYCLLVNHNPDAAGLKVKIETFVRQNKLRFDDQSPDLVFCIGGDGTFLQAFQRYARRLDQTIFVPVKAGVLGFYCTFNATQLERLFAILLQFKPQFLLQRSVLEVTDLAERYYAINEFKVLDHVGRLSVALEINGEHVEDFRGSGFIFSTASGSTGYARTISGAILLHDNMWQVQELAPISNAKFATVRSPLILNQTQTIRLHGDLVHKTLIFDNCSQIIAGSVLVVKLSTTRCRVLFDPQDHASTLTKIKSLFLPQYARKD